ncbi:Dihydroxyacetone ABC transport system, permease protein [Euzebya pacifica]|uniref:Dihydroxyacetone ABC transport system, permease protein n=1 Tax=Euzebya pacifica TaxID=1608957 RepID=A0A346Y512_9ACTN|nr:sugar ABC transporter permease [Euzebya pacifica]AXV09559.1 Dihydroxyacetone ABC transport system, permease protein [Euzebya pacifica]
MSASAPPRERVSDGDVVFVAPPAAARWRWLHDRWLARLSVAPTLLLLFGLFIFPLLYVLVLSFTDFSASGNAEVNGVGFENYSRLLTSDQVQAKALTTVLFVIGAVGLQTVLGFGLAYLVHRQKRGGGLLTVVFLIPMMLSPVIVGAFWRLMLDSSFGVVNGTLSMLGVDGPQWLSQQGVALLSLIFVDTWQWTPFIMVIALAGLNAVPSYLYEAADIDQASDWFKFKSITLPIVWPILLIAILFRVIDAFRLFDIVLIVTGGGPGGTTETLSFHIYKLAIRNFQTGLASAYGVLMLIVVNIMAVIFIKYLERLQSK